LVDEATVVIENIHTQMGKHRAISRAVFIGTAETTVPNLLAMLCILAVFLPSFLMEGAARGLFVPLAVAVGFAMIFAFVLSITFVPVLSVWLLRHSHADIKGRVEHEEEPANWLLRHVLRLRLARALTVGMSDSALLHKVLRWRRESQLIDTFVDRPIHWIRRHIPWGHHGEAERFTFARLQGHYTVLLRWLLGFRRMLIPVYVVGAVLVLGLVGTQVGREIAPQVDSGQFQLRIRAPSGTRLEFSEEITRQALQIIKDLLGAENVEISVAYVGVTAPTYTVNAIYLWTGGTDQAVMRISLRHGSGLRVAEIKDRLREELPKRLEPWLAQRLVGQGYTAHQATARSQQLSFSFEPADVVNQVMSFGSPTPIEVVVSGPNLANNRDYAEKVYSELRQISSLRDLQYGQVMDYPRTRVEVNRERAGFAGVTEAEAATAMIAATSSSRYVLPVFWADPKSGIGYQVQLEVPPAHINSVDEVGMIPVKQVESGGQLLLRDIAKIESGTMPEEYDRLNQMRYVSLTANIQGEDLGRVSARIDKALLAAGEPPRGVKVEIRGQVAPMLQMFHGLTVGLGMAVVVIFLLLTAYFQSIRLAFVAVATSPAVVAGVAVALYITGTTLNIESFMGAIMAIGVAVANAILLVTFAERHRRAGNHALEAAIHGARDRLRPILMTSCAMIAGMIPMALGMGEGGEQTAPLGRAVIGGLSAATMTTLLVLPSFFAVILSKATAHSPSLDPTDQESRFYTKLLSERYAMSNGNGKVNAQIKPRSRMARTGPAGHLPDRWRH
jgi:multidrug efflux pump subunit AcrB